MASAIDSGVDTGNESNDSSVQDKNSRMDVDPVLPKSYPSSSTSGGYSEAFEKLLKPDKPEIPPRPPMEPPAGLSFLHLQPESLRIGYEVIPPSERKIFEDEYKHHVVIKKMKALRFLKSSSFCPGHKKMKDPIRMCRAACINNVEAVREMLNQGMSANCHDCYHRTPLHLASCMGFKEMVQLLLEHGADPNAKDHIGNTPLHLAACTNHIDVINLLLKAGTNLSDKDRTGHSPLHLVVTKFRIMKNSRNIPHSVIKEQVTQMIVMLKDHMKQKEGSSIDPDLLDKFENLLRTSESTEQVDNGIRDILTNLSSLSLASSNDQQ